MAGENRGFVLNGQRVVLDLDFAGSLKATAYLTIKPTNVRLSTVFLHAAPCLRITAIQLSGPDIEDPLPALPASFNHYNPLLGLYDINDGQPINPNAPDAIQRHPDVKRKLWTAMAEKDEGELAIDVSHGWVRIAQVKEGSQAAQAGLAEILITIDYEITMSDVDTEGVVWRRPGDAGNDYRVPHIFIDSSSHDSARHWTPCLDNLWDRCPWELEIAVPRYLKQESDEVEDQLGSEDDIEDGELVRVIASAELEEQVVHPEDENKTLFYFVQSNPTSAQQMNFAAGPFHLHVLPEEDQTRRLLDSLDPTSDVQPLLLAYCLPGAELDLANTVSYMRQAMSFLEGFDGYPYSSFKMVFVEDPSTQSTVSASMGTFSQELLYPPDVIEQALITRPIMTYALASQWSGVHMIPKSFSDIWLVTGLALYVNAQLTRHLLGNNEYRFRLRADMDRCVALDQGDHFPLHVPGLTTPPDADTMQFISLKAPLVLHMLDMRMARLGTSSGLARNAIPDIFRQARGGTLQDRALSTENFFRICRKISKSLDIIAFQEQWVMGSGCPRFMIGAQYNKKSQSITVSVFQGASQAWTGVNQKEPQSLDWKCPTKYFSGEVTLWVNEGDGAPYEHVIELGDEGLSHELVFNPHQRRAHRLRNGHYRQEKGLPMLQTADDSGQVSAAVLETARMAEEWHFSGWSEADATVFVDQGFDWIRYDPECEWLASIEVLAEVSAGNKNGLAPVMLPYYWMSQLQSDRDVVAQREAIINLAAMPSGVAATALTKIILDERCFYKVRMLAIEMLPRMLVTIETGEKLGICHLSKFLVKRYCQVDGEGEALRLKPPQQDSVADYFVSQAALRTLAVWPWDSNNAKEAEFSSALREALTIAIEEGDAEIKTFSQSFYLSSLIANLAALQKRIPIQARQGPEYLRASACVDRAMALDKVLPSYGNVVTLSGLQAKFALAMTDKQVMPVHLPYFLAYTRVGNLPAVRRLAVDCVLTCQLPTPWLYKYIRQLLRREQSLSFRRHISEGIINSWLMALALGEIEGIHVPQSKQAETSGQRMSRETEELERDLPAWRRTLVKMPDIGRFVMSHLLDIRSDNDLRVALLQAAEALTPGRREGAAAKLILKLGSSHRNKLNSNVKSAPGAIAVESKSQVPKRKPKGRQYRNGLSEEDFKAVNITLEKLLVHPRSDFFRDPVPDNEAFAPGYYKIIKTPIDLSSIKHKLLDGQYENRHQFRDDLDLIVTNCKTYNGEGSPIFNAAVEFEKVFTDQWARVEKTLTKKAQNGTDATGAINPTLRLNVKRPIGTALPVQNPQSIELVPNVVRAKDFASGAAVEKPKSAMKNGSKRVSKPETREMNTDIMEALREEPNSDVMSNKTKKVKIIGLSKPPSGTTPKIKFSNVEASSSATTPKAIISLKRKLDGDSASTDRLLPTPPMPAAVPAIPIHLEQNVVAFNSKHLTEKGFTVDHTPFKRLRALKLLRELSSSYRVLFGPRPDEKLAPGYYKEIQKPMYFTLMEQKIDKEQYRTIGEFAADLEQILWNCRKYNGPVDEIEKGFAGPMEQHLLKNWPKIMMTDAMTPDERKIIDQWIGNMLKTPVGSWFQYPVDPVQLNLPDYFSIVKAEDARDLTMIKSKLKGSPSLSTIDRDIILMVDNAVKYNGPDSDVGRGAKSIENEYEKKRKQIQPHGSARASVESRKQKKPRYE